MAKYFACALTREDVANSLVSLEEISSQFGAEGNTTENIRAHNYCLQQVQRALDFYSVMVELLSIKLHAGNHT